MRLYIATLMACLLLVGCYSTRSPKSLEADGLPDFAQIRDGLPIGWEARQEGEQIVISSQYKVYFYNPISMPASVTQPGGLVEQIKDTPTQKPYRVFLSFGVKLEETEYAKLVADNAVSAEKLQMLKDEILPVYRKYDGKFMFSDEETARRRAPYFFIDFEPDELMKAERYEERKRSLVFHKLPLFSSPDHSVYVTDNNIFGLSLYPEKTSDDLRRVMKLLGKAYDPYMDHAVQ